MNHQASAPLESSGLSFVTLLNVTSERLHISSLLEVQEQRMIQ